MRVNELASDIDRQRSTKEKGHAVNQRGPNGTPYEELCYFLAGTFDALPVDIPFVATAPFLPGMVQDR